MSSDPSDALVTDDLSNQPIEMSSNESDGATLPGNAVEESCHIITHIDSEASNNDESIQVANDHMISSSSGVAVSSNEIIPTDDSPDAQSLHMEEHHGASLLELDEMKRQNVLLKCLINKIHLEVIGHAAAALPQLDCLTDDLVDEYICALKAVPRADEGTAETNTNEATVINEQAVQSADESRSIVENHSDMLEFSHFHDDDNMTESHLDGNKTEALNTNPFDDDSGDEKDEGSPKDDKDAVPISAIASSSLGQGKTEVVADEWVEYSERHACPPYSMNDPVVNHLLHSWTEDQRKIQYVLSWIECLSSPLPPKFPAGLLIVNVTSVVRDGFLILILPIIRDISIHEVGAYVRPSLSKGETHSANVFTPELFDIRFRVTRKVEASMSHSESMSQLWTQGASNAAFESTTAATNDPQESAPSNTPAASGSSIRGVLRAALPLASSLTSIIYNAPLSLWSSSGAAAATTPPRAIEDTDRAASQPAALSTNTEAPNTSPARPPAAEYSGFITIPEPSAASDVPSKFPAIPSNRSTENEDIRPSSRLDSSSSRVSDGSRNDHDAIPPQVVTEAAPSTPAAASAVPPGGRIAERLAALRNNKK